MPINAGFPLQLRVNEVKREAENIASFELASPTNRELPAFSAGAHVTVRVNDHIQRQYSLCNDPTERHRYLVAVLRDEGGRGGSVAMHALSRGSTVDVSLPRNHFPLAGKEASSHLLLAGGIGVTPMMAMIADLERGQRHWTMHYCTRYPTHTAFISRLEPYVREKKVFLHHDGGDPARGLNLKRTLSEFEIGTHLYFCGPQGFMRAIRESVGAWPPHNVHFEYFGASGEFSEQNNTPFQVRIGKVGRTLEVPAGKSIATVLKENGVCIETDCEQGYCGACITRYVEGEPEHRDTVLSESERERYVMICCARAKSASLTLEI